jgi:DNA-binding transcriptional regulator LsrR (DeoR family)
MDPNSFVRHFISDPPLPLEVRFVGVMAPGFIHSETVKMLRETEGIREAFARVRALDVLVTSAGGHWMSGCSRLHELYEDPKHSQILEELNANHCIGDLMWCPLGRNGPIVLGHGIRAMTLVDLTDLPGLISRGKRVVLVLAPCASCRLPKTEILKTLLELRQPLITDLVVDSFTARSVITELDSAVSVAPR